MHRVFNFNAGPAMLPEEVLRQAQAEMLDWQGTGMSVMELGHRGSEFQALAKQSEDDLRALMAIPDNYHVLFLAGGATTQFAMVPLNLFGANKKADYIDTGIWSKKAIAEAQRYGQVHIAATLAQRDKLAYIPPQVEWQLSDDAAYLHYTPNETIAGVEFHWTPQPNAAVPLVADMTSMILSQPIDVSQYGIIYAGAQKNIGQAGLTIVIIRNDLVRTPLPGTPTLYTYQEQVENHSFYNTPPTYSWYIASLVFAWMKRQGGVATFYAANQRKAAKLYRYLDEHADFYHCPVDVSCRSIMNVSFDLPNEALTQQFLQRATKAGLANLKGHRLAGGVRASIYNAMPEAGVDKLVEFMEEFRKRAV
ncbi:MAG TPA: 3-phosphoserine/phosphohydroxythreonine transaminase [Gammaproteobacteria bacterium]|jgi:phosphoserine aminotransferase|nr:3-phosphoserine/phosphohydroxythreonine transaminase [Gammaproteobacteria bacterium]